MTPLPGMSVRLYQLGDQSHVMMHACGPEDLRRISDVLLTVYDRCRDILGDKADW